MPLVVALVKKRVAHGRAAVGEILMDKVRGLLEARELREHAIRHVRILLDAGFGIEPVQHARVGADVDHVVTIEIRGPEVLIGLSIRRIFRCACVAGPASFLGVDEGRRTDIGRRRVDNVAEQASPAPPSRWHSHAVGAGARRNTSNVLDQIGVEAYLGGLRLVASARIKLDSAPIDESPYVPAARRRYLGARIPEQVADGAVRIHLVGEQLARPVTRIESCLVEPRITPQGAAVQHRRRRRAGAPRNVGQQRGQQSAELIRVLHVDEIATTVDRSVEEVILRGRAELDGFRPVDIGSGQNRREGVGRVDRCVVQSQADCNRRQMLPERRILRRGRHIVQQVRLQIVLPVVHGHVGQCAACRVWVTKQIGKRGLRGIGVGRAVRTGDGGTAGPIRVGPRLRRTRRCPTPVPVGEEEMICPPARLTAAASRQTVIPWRRRAEVLSDVIRRPAQRGVNGAGLNSYHGIQNRAAVRASKEIDTVKHRAAGCSVDLIYAPETHSRLWPELLQCKQCRGLLRVGPLAVERIPVGEVRLLVCGHRHLDVAAGIVRPIDIAA